MGVLQEFLENLPNDQIISGSRSLLNLSLKQNPNLDGKYTPPTSRSAFNLELKNLTDKNSRHRYLDQLNEKLTYEIEEADRRIEESYYYSSNEVEEATRDRLSILDKALDRYALALNYSLLSDPDSQEYSRHIEAVLSLIHQADFRNNRMDLTHWHESLKIRMSNLNDLNKNPFFVLQCIIDSPNLFDDFEIDALKFQHKQLVQDLPEYLQIYALSLSESDNKSFLEGYYTFGKDKANSLLNEDPKKMRTLISMFGPDVFKVLAIAANNKIEIPIFKLRDKDKEQFVRRYYESNKEDILKSQNIERLNAHILGISNRPGTLGDELVKNFDKLTTLKLDINEIAVSYEIVGFLEKYHDDSFTEKSLLAYADLKKVVMSRCNSPEDARSLMRQFVGLANILFETTGSDSFSLISALVKNDYEPQRRYLTNSKQITDFLKNFYLQYKDEIFKDMNLFYFIQMLDTVTKYYEYFSPPLTPLNPEQKMTFMEAISGVIFDAYGLNHLNPKLQNIDELLEFKIAHFRKLMVTEADLFHIFRRNPRVIATMHRIMGESIFKFLSTYTRDHHEIPKLITHFSYLTDPNIDILGAIYQYHSERILNREMKDSFHEVIKAFAKIEFTFSLIRDTQDIKHKKQHIETKEYILAHLHRIELLPFIIHSEIFEIPTGVDRTLVFKIIERFGLISEHFDIRHADYLLALEKLMIALGNHALEFLEFLEREKVDTLAFMNYINEFSPLTLDIYRKTYEVLEPANTQNDIFHLIMKLFDSRVYLPNIEQTEVEILNTLNKSKSDLTTCFDCLLFYGYPYSPEIANENGFLSFLAFKARFNAVENKVVNREQHGMDFYEFMNKFNPQISLLLTLMGQKAFEVLSRYGVMSNLPLERELSDLIFPNSTNCLIFLETIFKNYQNEIIEGQQHKTFFSFQKVFVSYMMISNQSIPPPQLVTKLLSQTKIEEVRQIMANETEKSFLQYMKLEDHVPQQELSKKIPVELFIKLISARNAMAGKFYEPVFDAFILHDMTCQPFKLANNEFNNQLIQHNQTIRHELEKAGIDLKKAFDLNRRTKEFTAGGTIAGVDVDQIARSIWGDLDQLLEVLDEKSKLKTDIINFRKFMIVTGETVDKPIKEMELESEQIKDFCAKMKKQHETHRKDPKQTTQIDALKNKLSAELKKMKQPENKADEKKLASFGEFLNHLDDHTNEINKSFAIVSQNDSGKLTRKKKFRIQVWDKDSPLTFNLGSEVGCCLAPDGSQFPAMVQRRMDDCMFMHVVIDEETQKVVSLAWLYYGQGKNPDTQELSSDIYVVANYFEITAALGIEPSYRDTIIHELQEYIGEYARDIKAKGLLLNPLTYGLIPDFENQGYPRKRIAVNKVGGFFYMGDSSDPYYLNSLKVSEFYDFKAAEPKIEEKPATKSMLRLSVDSKVPEQSAKQKPPRNSNQFD